MMKLPFLAWMAVVILCTPSSAHAQTHSDGHGQHTPYAGLHERTIKSLSDDDIAEIRRGGGWGLALPAELNGKPGPAHLLDLHEQLDLSQDQISEIERIHAEMRAEAIEAGERFIAAEAALSEAFVHSDLNPAELRELVDDAAAARAALRYVHLSRHLMTPSLLTDEQIERYAMLRGYRDDPCASVPDGHDPAMWRKHNGCE